MSQEWHQYPKETPSASDSGKIFIVRTDKEKTISKWSGEKFYGLEYYRTENIKFEFKERKE